MESINNRLRILYKKEAGSIEKLSEEIGVSLNTLKNVFSRGKTPSLDIVLKIVERYPSYSLDWILRGEYFTGDAPKESSSNLIEENNKLQAEIDRLKSELIDKERIIRLYEEREVEVKKGHIFEKRNT